MTSTVVVIYLAIIAAKFAAKPKLKIRFKNGKNEVTFRADEKATLTLYLVNQGHFIAKPAALNVSVYVNFTPIFEPIEIRFGSALEKSSREVKTGKGGRKYLKTDEKITLYHEELGEDIEVDVKMPEKEGRYPIEIPAYSSEGSCGFQRLWVNVIKSEHFPNSKN